MNKEKIYKSLVNSRQYEIDEFGVVILDEESLLGKVKGLIQSLNSQLEYAKNNTSIDEREWINHISNENLALVNELNELSDHEIILLEVHPMSGYYTIMDDKDDFQYLIDEIESFKDNTRETMER